MFGNDRRGGRGGDRGHGRGRGNGNGRGRGRGRGRGDYTSGARNGDKEHAREAAPTRVEETEEQSQARKTYGSWKRLLHEPVNNLATMRRFWKGAFDILEIGDRDRCQQLPRDLNNEDETGHRHILALLNTKVNASDYEIFITNARYFLLTITHPSLLRCLAVDTHVGLIYNLFSGVGGKSAVAFLQRLIQALSVAHTARMTWLPTEEFSTTLLAASVAVLELLRREPRVRFNDEVSTLVDSIQAAIDTTQDDDSSSTPVRIRNRLNEIRALLARAQGLVADKNLDDVTPTDDEGNSSSYLRDLIVPSDRFDNDKRDIVDIVLFPTRDEIMSDAKEFLPYTDPDQPHFLDDPVQRHIDTFFRLLRHDIFGELKGALAGIMHAITQNPAALNPKLHLGDVRANSYVNARVSYVTLDNKKGLQAQIEFLQPSEVRKKKETNKEKWWTDSRRFDEGTLLSFIWIDGAAVQHVFLTVSHKTTDPKQEHGLTHNNEMAYITTSLVTQDRMTVKSLMGANTGAACGLLLEFPRIMPATFAPVLECLQGMQRLSRLPFKEWIVPPRHDGPAGARKMHQIPPPLYARPPGFRFSLAPIMKERNRDVPLLIDSTHSCDDEVLIAKVENKTQLDRGQCRALVAALTREYAFIQGPPGTGKSYVGLQIMKVLLALEKKVQLGPILIVCYTNHALDQFLEHLLDIGVKKLIRMGGMSKSKRLENHNLRGVSDSEPNTKAERYMAAMNYKELDKKQKDAKSLFAALHGLRKNPDWQHLKGHVSDEYPRIHSQFPIVDDEGFRVAGRHPFDIWVASSEFPRTRITDRMIQQIIQKANQSVHFLSPQERGALIEHWIQEAQSNRIGELYEIVDEVAKTQRQLNNIHEEVNRRVLEGAQVIGVTTSGLAKRISVLQQVRCKVIICEEAGEVMESHMICALLPDAEHVIQIGDHEQLRPSVNNFRDLSLESERGKLHQLDRSQFERLSVGEPGRPLMPVAQLNVQRRMRPQISSLIRETIYGKLEDHPSTTDLPDVVGMRHNVFWLDHTNFEAENDANAHITKSKSNMWEVGMVHALVRHIVRQGIYKPDDIAVLTPYTGQLQKLRATMRSDFEICLSDRDKEALENDGFEVDDDIPQAREAPAQQSKPLEKKQLSELLRIATVDNFQGEEAKIIIVSLVRSNDKQKVGFLRTSNRINVLLSRAQHGMYLIGNTQTYTSVEMWQKVIDMLNAAGCVGKSLALSCPRHPAIPIQVHEPEDFHKYSPEGGCMEACTDRLDCGHRCGARCHSKTMHAVFRCEQPCQRQHQPCGHSCQKATCGEPCGKCMVLLDNVQLPCGHFKHSVACHRTQNLATISCDVKVTKRVPGCEHDVVVKCSSSVSNESYKCPTPCAIALLCSHPCPGTCGQCNTKDGQGQTMVKHAICSKICGRKHGTCSHNCKRRCHDGTDCGLCQSPCEVRCKHTKCPQKCHEPCAPCTERCVWSCEHQGDCKMPCSAPCNRLPCDERCTKLLPCGHQCPSICGEDCPINYCQQCGMKSEELPDMIMMSRYADVDLNESPIVVLNCGHFFTTETLDGLVGLKDVYEFDEKTGRFIGLIDNAELSATIPKCPNCREPIKQYVTQRYNRLINRAVIDEMSKRFIVNGQQELQSLEERLGMVRDDLEKSRKDIVPASPIIIRREVAHELTMQRINDKIKKRYRETINLMDAVKSFRCRVRVQHQPAYKLHQATIHSIANSPSLDAKFAKLAIGSSSKTLERDRDQRVTLGGVLLEIKVQCLLLEDNLEITRAISFLKLNTETLPAFSGGSPMAKTERFLKDCKKLIKDCKSECLPKLAVETALYYARIAYLFGQSRVCKDTDRKKAEGYRKDAQNLLAEAENLCKNSFRGRDTLLQAIASATKMLRTEFYEEVSKEELGAIKRAMVSGHGGIATHSGHWYNCVNGHPFAIGECGMPMERARCPECGEPIGGQNHTAVAGVSRATEMEN